ncbi:DUF4265 domain-containing protein [Diaphorobacter sp.]|uniref:DUF4265 domain-containing protein n=1 Tax=Diaphorobacter sp. TaxID=1934310 RepID=UPI0028AE08FA|nr:DUF4265 domain-containing protein [Diaphorobacter sp.]
MEESIKYFLFYVATPKAGNVVREKLPVINYQDGSMKVLASPGLALGFAKDDVVKVLDENTYPKILKRSGYLCIQIYAKKIKEENLTSFSSVMKTIFNASIDGWTENNIAVSICVRFGFERIEKELNYYCELFNWEWYFGNVYNTEDEVTPLNWWQDFFQ